MTREDFDRAAELVGRINKWKTLIDDINNGTIEIGISVPDCGVSRINRYINEISYKMICDIVKNSIEQDLADTERELAEL